jgi:hypothetical protein
VREFLKRLTGSYNGNIKYGIVEEVVIDIEATKKSQSNFKNDAVILSVYIIKSKRRCS